MRISEKVQSMNLSPIRKFNPVAAKVEAKGKKIYHLNCGQPDIRTPDCFMNAIRNFNPDVIAYADSHGLTELHNAISSYFKQYGMDFAPKDIIVTNGGSEAIIMSFMTMLNPGDQVLIPEPFYTNYNTFSKISGGVVVPITTKAEDGYVYADKNLIEPLITDKTKAIVCISPGNPTGNVLSKEEIKTICEIAEKHDLWILADEVYREFVYDGREVASFGMFPEYSDRVIIVDSVSKRFSACGARIGYIASKNVEFMANILKLAQGRLCVSTVDQVGATALFSMTPSYYEEVRETYCKRRNTAYEELQKIPGIICEKPGGSFYLTAKLPVESVEDFLLFMLEDFEDNGETTMFTPAEGFYSTSGLGKNEMRIAYVLNEKDMKRAVELIRLGFEAYNRTRD